MFNNLKLTTWRDDTGENSVEREIKLCSVVKRSLGQQGTVLEQDIKGWMVWQPGGLVATSFIPSSLLLDPWLCLDSNMPILENKSCLMVILLSLLLMDRGMGLGYSFAPILGNIILLSDPLPFLASLHACPMKIWFWKLNKPSSEHYGLEGGCITKTMKVVDYNMNKSGSPVMS